MLATLASKPVLAVSWNCTISGQLSGNVSGHGEECTNIGESASSLASNTYKYPSNAMSMISVLFSDSPVLSTTNYFFISGESTDPTTGIVSGGTLSFSSSGTQPSGSSPASINQILHLPTPSGREYAVKALVLLLNAKDITDPSVYPLIRSQAERMYVAAATGGSFSDTNPTVDWSNAEVLHFVNLLYYP
ncbi:MAG: hypothetical protein PHD37_13380 [Gallionellaceae bacterium]|nr:hypothetical protein [Gallionellaceae bacterium]